MSELSIILPKTVDCPRLNIYLDKTTTATVHRSFSHPSTSGSPCSSGWSSSTLRPFVRSTTLEELFQRGPLPTMHSHILGRKAILSPHILGAAVPPPPSFHRMRILLFYLLLGGSVGLQTPRNHRHEFAIAHGGQYVAVPPLGHNDHLNRDIEQPDGRAHRSASNSRMVGHTSTWMVG